MAKKAAGAKKKTARTKTAASAAKKAAARSSRKRETLTRGGKNVAYATRRADGTFKNIVDVGRSLSADRRTKAKTAAKKGYGDRGD